MFLLFHLNTTFLSTSLCRTTLIQNYMCLASLGGRRVNLLLCDVPGSKSTVSNDPTVRFPVSWYVLLLLFNIILFYFLSSIFYLHLDRLFVLFSYSECRDGVDVFVLCFSLTSKDSLDSLVNYWAPLARRIHGVDVPLILCGTMSYVHPLFLFPPCLFLLLLYPSYN